MIIKGIRYNIDKYGLFIAGLTFGNAHASDFWDLDKILEMNCSEKEDYPSISSQDVSASIRYFFRSDADFPSPLAAIFLNLKVDRKLSTPDLNIAFNRSHDDGGSLLKDKYIAITTKYKLSEDAAKTHEEISNILANLTDNKFVFDTMKALTSPQD